MTLEELFGGPSARPRIEASQRRLKAMAAEEGLPMTDRTMTYNSRRAQELGAWAADRGHGAAFDSAMFRAYFAGGRNIADRALLIETAVAAGLESEEAARVLDERLYKETVDRHWKESRRSGVTAVPTFEAGGRLVVGAQPYEELEKLVIAAGARKRANSSDPAQRM